MAGESEVMTVAVANATTPLALESVRDAYALGIIEPILIGRHDDIHDAARVIDWDISECRIEIAGEEAQAAAVSVALAASGEASAIMKGNIHTDVLMRAIVNRHAGLRTERLMSHIFHMTLPGDDQALCITDAAIHVDPSVNQKTQIVKNAVSLMLALGYKTPNIALISATEIVSAAIPSTVDAAKLLRLAALGAFPGAIVDGPMPFDVAVSLDAARRKGIDSLVAGRADVLLMPNIETGNALFKSMTHLMGAVAAGIVLGAKVPIVLTSRADSSASRLASIALAAIVTNQRAIATQG